VTDAVDPTDPERQMPERAITTPGAAAGTIVIEARDLTRVYGTGNATRTALDHVAFAVQARQIVLIFGPSGSGKSTLLRLLGGLDRNYSGKLSLFGQDLAELGDGELSALRNRRIGFVFQTFHLLDHLSALANVTAPSLFGEGFFDPVRAKARAFEVLERVGLADRAGAMPNELSGGQRQRAAIARALFNEPALLLCDEPTGNLDRETGAQIIELFARLHESLSTTIVIVTHEDRVSRIAERTLHMHDGQLLEPEA